MKAWVLGGSSEQLRFQTDVWTHVDVVCQSRNMFTLESNQFVLREEWERWAAASFSGYSTVLSNSQVYLEKSVLVLF